MLILEKRLSTLEEEAASQVNENARLKQRKREILDETTRLAKNLEAAQHRSAQENRSFLGDLQIVLRLGPKK